MATVGTKRTIPFTVGTGAGAIVGQGGQAIPWLLYTTDDASVGAPDWLDATELLRGYSTSRGRESELADIDAGTATFTLDDRERTFDPTFNTAIRPMNQWWLQEGFSGLMHSVFKGYAESYQEQWVKGAEDAQTTVSCVDEFKVLALDRLPTTNPPRDSYQNVVLFDEPSGYWPMDGGDWVANKQNAIVGDALFGTNGPVAGTGAIVGQEPLVWEYLTGTDGMLAPDAYGDAGKAGHADGLDAFAVERWFAWSDGLPSSNELLNRGPLSNTTWSWQLSFTTAGQLLLEAKNSSGTNHSVTTTSAPTAYPDVHHIVGTIEGGFLGLYVNGVLAASTAWTGAFGTTDAFGRMSVGNEGTTIGARVRYIDELAFYQHGLTAARVLAHYQAGRQRGFARGQIPNERITAVLDTAGNQAPRSIRVGAHPMIGSYMVGQSPLDEMRKAETANAVDAVLFIAKDGTITFLDESHRGTSPWNTVQATFDDDGTDFPYQDIGMDYSDAFLANEWNVTRVGGTTQTASDATSISRYFKRSQSLNDLQIESDFDAENIAADMLAKYKDPMRRVTRLEVLAHDADVIDNLLAREIGDRIRVFRTPPGGGARLDVTLFIQKISVTGVPGQPRRIVLGVSPL